VLASAFKTSAQLRLENLALRHQLVVLATFNSETTEADDRPPKRLALAEADLG
jgi:hypothetical protein